MKMTVLSMSIFTRFFKRNVNEEAANPPSFAGGYTPFVWNHIKQDGTSFACMDRIASELANLNYGIYDAKTRQKVKRHSLYAVIQQPNLDDRHFNFFYQSVLDYFSGGCFWFKGTVDGKVVNLWRLDPSLVTVRRNEKGRRVFEYQGKTFTSKEILYIPSRFGYSSESGGKSIFNAIKAVFDTANTLEQYSQQSFTNGITGKRLVVDISKAYPNATPEQLRKLKESYQKEYSGPENSGRPLFKLNGIEYSEVGGTGDNKNAELSENRKFQEHEVSKIFGIPEGILTVSKETNLENTFTLFCEFAIRPVAVQFQEALNSLLDELRFYFEFDFNGIMKVSLAQRVESYSKQITNGLLSPNEARAKENLEPIEAGDNHFMPVNLMPLNDETIEAYMAKQKNEIANGGKDNPTDPDAQHFGGGDDKS